MMTIKDFAKKKKISMKMARHRLERQVEEGLMQRKKGPCNVYLYYEITPRTFRWHDPFNLVERRTA